MAENANFQEFVQAVVGAIPTDLPGSLQTQWVDNPDKLVQILRQALLAYPESSFPSYSVTVNYNQTVEELVKAGKYDWVNDNITDNNFPTSGDSDETQLEIHLVNFNRYISSEDAIEEMDHYGLRPATLKELLALGIAYPELQRQNLIVALGSKWRVSSGDLLVPYLCGFASERRLCLSWFEGDWNPDWRFAAVRK